MKLTASIFPVLSLATFVCGSVHSGLRLAAAPESTNSSAAPTLTHLFDIKIQLDVKSILSNNMIPIPSGITFAEPFLNGTVTGPALNGTIRGGVAYPEIYNATGVEFSTANVWGTTSDGTSFAVQESGVGTTTRQISRLTVNIGGNYSKLATTFILGDVVGNVTDGTVLIKAYGIW